MEHTLVAVFDQRADAQKALEDLVASGFSRQAARLSETPAPAAGGTARSAAGDDSFGASIRHFLSDIFGTDRSADARMYADAVNRGRHVLTLVAASEQDVERAADIVERYGPIDIDEHAQQWRGDQGSSYSGAAGMSQQATQQGAGQSSQYQGAQQRAADTQAIPVVREELKIGKRNVERGGVRIYQRVVETPVSETVGLREEHVVVERHEVDRPLTPADLDAFKETTIELRETAEEAVVEKSARVVEEVVVGKEVRQRQENIADSVRHTEIEIEQLAPDDEAYFRGHWTSNYAATGGNYAEYAPAYSYGSSMARSELYRGRPWEEVEPSLRSDWETRNPTSGWERFKAAVRHGWERITS
jgi:uncharacterized protein (TIGR02271 family)